MRSATLFRPAPAATGSEESENKGTESENHDTLATTPELLSVAFEKAWRFVKVDPMLAHNEMALLRNTLRQRLQQLHANGVDALRLANSAILELRRELGKPAPIRTKSIRCDDAPSKRSRRTATWRAGRDGANRPDCSSDPLHPRSGAR